MDPGFVADFQHNSIRQTKWTAGEPQVGKFLGIEITGSVAYSQARTGLPITVFRCPKCGCLESYAFVESKK
jgi:hypothetical protein